MATAAIFRRIALALPQVVAGEHMAHADFRTAGRIFASLPDERRGMVKVPVAEQQRLVAADGDVFTPAAGAWGRAGCTYVVLAAVDSSTLAAVVASAWQWAHATAASTRKRPAKRRRGTASRARKRAR